MKEVEIKYLSKIDKKKLRFYNDPRDPLSFSALYKEKITELEGKKNVIL